jgi:hypothetical protein
VARRNSGTGANAEKNTTVPGATDGNSAASAPPSAERGSIGQQIYEQVQELVAREGITRSAAFARISEATGRQAGTVSANYYRVARQHGTGRGPRRKAGTSSQPRPRGRRRATTGPSDAIRNVQQALSTALGRQDAEIARLRAENANFAELRRLIDGQRSGRGRQRRG